MDATDRSTPLFKGGSRIKISAADLPSIKINIHRNIPGTSVVPCEPQRDTINPEEITLKRREGNVFIFIKIYLLHCVLMTLLTSLLEFNKS